MEMEGASVDAVQRSSVARPPLPGAHIGDDAQLVLRSSLGISISARGALSSRSALFGR
jgi:hypothetical protein